MKRLLPLLLLLVASFVNAQVACVKTAQITADTTPFDVTCTDFGTVTAFMIWGGYSTALNTTTVDAGMVCGVGDFTVEGALHSNAEDDQATTDAHSEHTNTLVFLTTTPGTGADERTIVSASSITNGIRLTPGAVGTQQYQLVVTMFNTEAHVFNSGDGTVQPAGTEVITHGLAAKPKAGLYCYGVRGDNSSGVTGRIGFGFHHDDGGITQRAVAYNADDGEIDGESHGHLSTSVVAFTTNAGGGGIAAGFTLTTNDGTASTYTCNAGGGNCDSILGILLTLADNDAWVGTMDSPNATGTWTNTDTTFTPQLAMIVPGQLDVIDTAFTDDPKAGTYSAFATDFAVEASASFMDENGISNSNTASRVSTELWLGDDDQTEDYACNGFSATATGFTANCDTADAGTDLWIALMIEEDSAGGHFWNRRH